MTVKKIALSLFLAGYAASGAFAAPLIAQTNRPIEGNAPILTATKASAENHTVTLRVSTDAAGTNLVGKGVSVQVGNYIVIKYKISDVDGDKDDGGTIANSLKVFAKKGAAAWEEMDLTGPDANLTVTSNNDEGTITFKVTKQFVAADKIGFKILERTEFGLPYANKWLAVSNIWDLNHNPDVIDPTDPANPTGTGPTDPGTGDHGTGDGSENNGTGPVIGVTTKVGIFKYNAANQLDTTVNYAAQDIVPKYGDKFGAVVWDEDENSNNNIIDQGEKIITGSYTLTWTLAGSYTPPAGGAAIPADTTTALGGTSTVTGVNDTIVLGSADGSAKHNTLYPNANYKAGAQGYNLHVATDH